VTVPWMPSIPVDAGTVLMQEDNTDEDMSNFRACSLCSIVEKEGRSCATLHNRQRLWNKAQASRKRSIDKGPRCRVSCATSIIWKVDIFSLGCRNASFRSAENQPNLILHSRVVTKATRLRHSAFQGGCEIQERHVTMRMKRRRRCHPGVRRDNGTAPSGDSAQPLWEAEFS